MFCYVFWYIQFFQRTGRRRQWPHQEGTRRGLYLSPTSSQSILLFGSVKEKREKRRRKERERGKRGRGEEKVTLVSKL